MEKEMEFFIYLIENYAKYKDTSADNVLREWDSLGITSFIYDMYQRYSTERIENAFDDIDRLSHERHIKE